MTDNDIVKDLKELLGLMLNYGDLQGASTISKAIEMFKRQNAEIENLSIALEVTRDNLGDARQDLNNAETEIERLREMVSQNEGVLPKYENLIKGEAIKEALSRVESELGEYYMAKHLVIGTVLDKVRKEMVGDVG